MFSLCFPCVFLLQRETSHSRTWGWYQVKGGIEPPSQDLQSRTLAFMLLNLTFSIRAEKGFTLICCVFVFCSVKNKNTLFLIFAVFLLVLFFVFFLFFFCKKKTRKNAVCKRPLSAKQTRVVSGGRTRTYGLEIMSLTRLPSSLPRQKESIQPQVPLRLPCYDFTPVTRQVIVTPLKGETLSFFWKRKR